MIDWMKKTAVTFGTMVKDTTKNAANTPAPIGKTVAVVLVVEGVILVTLLVTHKVKFVAVIN